jgi:hypothetical protein
MSGRGWALFDVCVQCVFLQVNEHPRLCTPPNDRGIIFMLEAAGVIYLVIPGDAGSVRAKMVSSQCSPMCWHVP